MADNIDAGYLQYVVGSDFLRNDFNLTAGAKPWGEGLQTWLRRTPGFNVHKIDAPLRQEVHTGGIRSAMFSWEMFSQLRYNRKPVELYFRARCPRRHRPLGRCWHRGIFSGSGYSAGVNARIV